MRAVISELRRLIGRKNGCTLTDTQLLDAFVKGRDEASFEVLVWRHGTMVLSLCQRILRDSHEAEDAFQAAFLVFARKAGSIGKRESIGSWLYKVAYRIALRLRARTRKNPKSLLDLEGCPPDDHAAPASTDDLVWRDLRPVLDEEIERLPDKYRAPFVLCHLEGHTNEEAAEQLGCPKGTILSRLSRGRERLRSRLARRGVALTGAWLATVLPQKAAAAAPAALVDSTVKAALPFAAGNAAAGLVSTPVAALTEGVLRTMFLTRLKIAAAALVALAGVGIGTGWLAHQALAQRDKGGRGAVREAPKPPDVAGYVVAVAKDGSTFTVQIPGRGGRGEPVVEPKKIDIKLGDKTVVTYHGVGPDGARPTVGYAAQVQLEKGTTDVATSVAFRGVAANRGSADVAGKVVAVAKDGKGITLELPKGRDRPREEEPPKMEVTFNDKTVVSYFGVTQENIKLVEGLHAQVMMVDGPKGSIAGSVVLFSPDRGGRSRKPPDVTGKVVGVAGDGKSISVEIVPARGAGRRGEAAEEAKKADIKLGDKTTVVFNNVSAGAKIAVGLHAQVWLEEGSKDSAASVTLTGQVKDRWARVDGKVIAVSKDGKTITLEQPLRRDGRRAEVAKKIDIKIADNARVVYYGIGPDGARPSEGYLAQVRLVDEPKDTADQITFIKPGAFGRR
jgi:RNA polymerase sigma factor (sigma-70 family)